MRRSVSRTLRDRYPWEAALMSCCWAAAVAAAAAATAASRPVNRSPWETTTDNPAVPDHGTWTWVEDLRPLGHYCGVGTLLGNPADTTRHKKLYYILCVLLSMLVFNVIEESIQVSILCEFMITGM